MELKGDIPLKGVAWDTAITNYSGIFEPRTQYMLFVLSLASRGWRAVRKRLSAR